MPAPVTCRSNVPRIFSDQDIQQSIPPFRRGPKSYKPSYMQGFSGGYGSGFAKANSKSYIAAKMKHQNLIKKQQADYQMYLDE